MQTNPCSETHLNEMFPEDYLVRDLEGVDVSEELISEVIEQASDLVGERISTHLPGYKGLSIEEISLFLNLHYTFASEFSLGSELEVAIALVPVLAYKSKKASLGCLNGCIKIIRNMYIKEDQDSPIKLYNSYEKFATKLNLILQPLAALKPVADV